MKNIIKKPTNKWLNVGLVMLALCIVSRLLTGIVSSNINNKMDEPRPDMPSMHITPEYDHYLKQLGRVAEVDFFFFVIGLAAVIISINGIVQIVLEKKQGRIVDKPGTTCLTMGVISVINGLLMLLAPHVGGAYTSLGYLLVLLMVEAICVLIALIFMIKAFRVKRHSTSLPKPSAKKAVLGFALTLAPLLFLFIIPNL